jgi:prolipoprotein diacylglyceryltransferase
VEFTLLFAVLTAGAAMAAAARLLRSNLAGMDSPVDRLIRAAVVGLFVGRVASMVSDGVNPLTNPGTLILIRAGVRTEIAASVAVAAALWMWRRELPFVADALAPVAVAGLSGWHAGCVWRSTCLGRAADVSWGWALDGSDVTRHPVELYAAALLLLVVPLLVRLRSVAWAPTGGAIAAAAVSRLVTEPVRVSLTGGPTTFYAVAFVVGIAVVGFGVRSGNRSTTPNQLPTTA